MFKQLAKKNDALTRRWYGQTKTFR